ncbi:glycoside hydrolase family 3 C-terminal domain-containing protein [Streptomyces sp. NRRL S-37]|uniref:glycoside hydrolase family 3 C-terminal domain-containing protein n=1 Tax=Streptomyces sp. NRRL S-37 TaxID=1463903 RepID=UPI0004C61DC4|nr:glycoside hydrolase family 3 N-terminal domain-containing protein [Streptomyces sp. NRRL S-37]
MTADVAVETTPEIPLWNDPAHPVAARVDALIGAMTLQEKIAQLYGVWVGASANGGEVAPHQHDMEEAVDLDALLPAGLGQLTRPFGTDARWGRVEETIGEDPYLVGTIGTAYVQGLESAGIVATLKHFVGYSVSRAGRNLAPVSVGPRERADVLLPPFEMAIHEGGVRSVMHSYTDTDGVPSAADEDLLTGLLRDTWGFDGTVVADYFGIAFLKTLHGVAADFADAAGAALKAGVDVELPTVKTFGAPLVEAVTDGRVPETLIDRARRIDLDRPENRELAREIAEKAVVLLTNDGTLPLAAPRRIALVGPNAAEGTAVLGCYSFPQHVGVQHPDVPVGIDLPTLRETLAAEFPDAEITTVRGTGVDDGDLSGIGEAVDAAEEADIVIAVLGDRAGLFGRGTSGEGCDAESLALPGAQQHLLDALLDSGTPVVTVLLAGRPYALGRAVAESAAIVQSFFPGVAGTHAIAGVLSGRTNPSGRLPVGVPRGPGSQPTTYLGARLAQVSEVSNIDPTPAFGFGHGLTYTSFTWSDLAVDAREAGTDGEFGLALTVRNTGERPGTEVVQLYLHDPVASVVQPVQRLVGYTRVELEPGESRRVRVTVPADVASFTGRDGRRIVEPGDLELRLAASSTDARLTATVTLTGPERQVDHTRRFHASFTQEP